MTRGYFRPRIPNVRCVLLMSFLVANTGNFTYENYKKNSQKFCITSFLELYWSWYSSPVYDIHNLYIRAFKGTVSRDFFCWFFKFLNCWKSFQIFTKMDRMGEIFANLYALCKGILHKIFKYWLLQLKGLYHRIFAVFIKSENFPLK